MRENILETKEHGFTIEELHKKKAELEALEQKDIMVSAELEEVIDNEIEIGE